MPIRTMTTTEAHQAMGAEKSWAFVDVRTEAEYERGHPQGARNIPWALVDPGTGQMVPNPAFLPTLRQHAATTQRVFLSCQMGGRSLRACQELEAAGYTDLVNVDGGFGGRRDLLGRLAAPGWRDAGLPVESGPANPTRPEP